MESGGLRCRGRGVEGRGWRVEGPSEGLTQRTRARTWLFSNRRVCSLAIDPTSLGILPCRPFFASLTEITRAGRRGIVTPYHRRGSSEVRHPIYVGWGEEVVVVVVVVEVVVEVVAVALVLMMVLVPMVAVLMVAAWWRRWRRKRGARICSTNSPSCPSLGRRAWWPRRKP